MRPEEFLYYYKAQVIRVVDGDTLDVQLSLGFQASLKLRLRVLGVDTPERGQPGFENAISFVLHWLAHRGNTIYINTVKTDSFGRWLANVYDEEGDSLAEDMIEVGRGVRCER